jgi:hypothetical protein
MFSWFKKRDSSPKYLKLEGTNVYRARVRTAKRGEIVEVRFTKSGDISPDEGGYFVRKVIVGPTTFDRATLEIRFNSSYGNPVVTVDGGEAVPVSEWK